MAPFPVSLASPHQSLIKKMSRRPMFWRHFLNRKSRALDGSSLCQANTKLTNTKSEADISSPPPLLHFIHQGKVSLNPEPSDQLVWLAHLSTYPKIWSLHYRWPSYLPEFFVCSRDLNSGLHVYSASVLPAEPPAQPQTPPNIPVLPTKSNLPSPS